MGWGMNWQFYKEALYKDDINVGERVLRSYLEGFFYRICFFNNIKDRPKI